MENSAGERWDGAAFVERLRYVMGLDEVSQSELARRIGTRQTVVNAWFVKGAVPSGDLIVLLPRALHVHGDWLFHGRGVMRGGRVTGDSDAAFRDGLQVALSAVREAAAGIEASYLGGAVPSKLAAAPSASLPASAPGKARAAVRDARRTDAAARAAKRPAAEEKSPARQDRRFRGAS